MNWNLPTLTSLYTDALTYMKERTDDVATMFRSSTSTNLPTGSIRWSDSNNRFESWDGSLWVKLSPLYEAKVREATKISDGGVTITLGGDLTGTVTFDGSETTARTLSAQVANDSHDHDEKYELKTDIGTEQDFDDTLTT